MTRSFPKIPDEVRSLPKKSKVFRTCPKSSEDVQSLPKAKFSRKRLSTKSEIARKVLSFIHFTHGLSQHIFGNCVKQDGNNSHFSIRREKLARKREPA